MSYNFESIGPNGIIKKIIQFEKIKGLTENIYNLTLGDWDENKRKLDDLAISNNNDTSKVLFTVAHTILVFTDHRPDSRILFAGSTESRTRLYQIAISKNFKEINKLFDIQGFKNGYWKEFQPSENFEAFLVKRRLREL
jgi:hypothetical protein